VYWDLTRTLTYSEKYPSRVRAIEDTILFKNDETCSEKASVYYKRTLADENVNTFYQMPFV